MRRKISIFELLGVRPEDERATIRSAWRRKVREMHPDVTPRAGKEAGDTTADLAAINAAFDMLRDHTPFAERRRGARRQTRRSRRIWTEAERAEMLRKQAEAEANARAEKKAQKKAEARAQRQAEAQKRAKADAARKAKAHTRTTARSSSRPYSLQDARASKQAASGYAMAFAATSIRPTQYVTRRF